MIPLAFALRGVDWAVKMIEDPEFNLKEKMLDYERRKKEQEILKIEDQIKFLQHKIQLLKESQ